MVDPILAAGRLPRLAERAMREAILFALARRRCTPRALIDQALLRFERAAGRSATGAARPCVLFAERDRIVRELRAFIDSRLAARLAALHRRSLSATGRAAAPFDAIVRNRRGRTYGVVFRRVPPDGRRLELLRRAQTALEGAGTPVDGVLLYDFVRANAKLVLHQPRADRVDCYLRAS
jgi:hypothetical protein